MRGGRQTDSYIDKEMKALLTTSSMPKLHILLFVGFKVETDVRINVFRASRFEGSDSVQFFSFFPQQCFDGRFQWMLRYGFFCSVLPRAHSRGRC